MPRRYMIEGVWPHVRDDDWCGEWKLATRRVDTRITEVSTGPLVPSANPPSPMPPSMPARQSRSCDAREHRPGPSIMPLPGVVDGLIGRGD